jgi:serine/threonine protein kinase
LRNEQALLVALQAAQALDHLHRELGIVHQDVTPANLIVRCGWSGAVHTTLIDLGSAEAPEYPRRHVCYGAEPYIAPERLRDPSLPPDPQCDIFALGVVLQQLMPMQNAKGKRQMAAQGIPMRLDISANAGDATVTGILAAHGPPSDLADLIGAMTQPDVAQRRAAVPTMGHVVARLDGVYRRYTQA